MPLDPAVYEKLGVFYLGRILDPETHRASDAPLLYDSRDLLTHAVCVGMTGSGKTGLCLSLLEEAALDGVPAIIIDPKGDLGNLLLTFPELRPEDFRPWINEEDARRKGIDPETHAKDQAKTWRTGLEAWGQSANRIAALREKTDMVIYTPGSSSGVPVNILTSFEAPAGDNAEALADRVQTAASSLLGLLKINADPLSSREYILLAALLTDAWKKGQDMDIAGLIPLVQHPPFEKLGVLDIESFYPAKDRFGLVMALNNLLASPGFAAWQQGEDLEIGRLLWSTDGKPRLAIFSIAHLSDEERMFFVSLLLNEVLAWTRAQSGTSSLRAILYMDEIFGYLPPTANPPSKQPLLTLLKQARAFGVGVVLATQNPVDLDYKALSNAGTWFLGRLQTERDKARVLDGLEGAAGKGFDRRKTEALLAGLSSRVFLMNNVHEDAPVLFETRWAMSYLRGPLTRDQIKTLMSGRKAGAAAPSGRRAAAHPARPTLPPAIRQVFVPAKASSQFFPNVLGAAAVTFSDAKLGVSETRELVLSAPVPAGASGIDWDAAGPLDVCLDELETNPPDEAIYGELPGGLRPDAFAAWEKAFSRWLATGPSLCVWRSPELNLTSQPGETKAEFSARIALAAREERDDAVEKLRSKYAPKLAALQVRLTRAQESVRRQKDQASSARMQSYISIGSTLLNAFLGRKALSATTMSKAATAARGVERSIREGSDIAAASEGEEAIRRQIEALETEFQAESAALAAQEPVIESVEIKPRKSGSVVKLFALAWIPV